MCHVKINVLLQGVLRIHVIGAKELVKADLSLMGKGKSDPYTVVRGKLSCDMS